MRISILSIICVCGESKNVAEYYCDAFDCAIMLMSVPFLQVITSVEITLAVETLEETSMQEITIGTLEVQVAALEAIKPTLVGLEAKQTRAVASTVHSHNSNSSSSNSRVTSATRWE